ncbi:hypothetical protein RRG08_036981 [Elysia crispata]|uniref:Uncharacterized protein n=1 Tax=Elysia crispata TaxID=231223 RepID=A0AAE0XTH7_9GAST|nr:hypothetical protein RRG08_036981 [Elysia crispata]
MLRHRLARATGREMWALSGRGREGKGEGEGAVRQKRRTYVFMTSFLSQRRHSPLTHSPLTLRQGHRRAALGSSCKSIFLGP